MERRGYNGAKGAVKKDGIPAYGVSPRMVPTVVTPSQKKLLAQSGAFTDKK